MTEHGVVDRGGVFEAVLVGKALSGRVRGAVHRLGEGVGVASFGKGADGVDRDCERKSASLPGAGKFVEAPAVAAADNKGLGTRLSILRLSWTLLCGS